MCSPEDSKIETDKDEFGLAEELDDLPLHILYKSTLAKIALHLDQQIDILHPEKEILIDYRGVAESVGFGQLEIKSFERQKSPTLELLSKWEPNLDLKPTLGNLWRILISLDRKDILEDCKAKIEKDGQLHLEQQKRLEEDYIPKQDGTVTSSSEDHMVNETELLTLDDVTYPGTKVIYDAFISYNNTSQKDGDFVEECIRQLETPEHGLKLLVPERDFVAGGAKHFMDAKLIKSRCKRMLIVLSHDYIHSVDCDFRLKFAHSLAPGARQNRLIPVITEGHIMLPDILRHVNVCDYTKQDLKDWFWPRLALSLKAPVETENMSEYSFPQSRRPLPTQSSSSSTKKQKKDKYSWSTFFPSRKSSVKSNSSTASTSSTNSSDENDIAGSSSYKSANSSPFSSELTCHSATSKNQKQKNIIRSLKTVFHNT